MATTFVHVGTAVSAGTAISLDASDAAFASFNGLQKLEIMPLASGGAASTVSPIKEVAISTGTPTTGQCKQESATSFVTGDNVPADSVIIVVYNAVGETLNPSLQ